MNAALDTANRCMARRRREGDPHVCLKATRILVASLGVSMATAPTADAASVASSHRGYQQMASVSMQQGGGWYDSTSYPNPGNATSVALGALRTPALLDIVTGNSDGSVSVLLNQGGGRFASPLSYAVSSSYPVSGVALTDLTGSGRQDLVATVGDPTSATGIAVLLSNGDGTFQAPIFTPTTIPGGYQDRPSAVAAGDFNKDGLGDVAVGFIPGGANRTEVRVYPGDGTGHFGAGVAYDVTDTYGSVEALRTADLAGNGTQDLIASNETCGYNGGNIMVLKNDGTGRFSGAPLGLRCPGPVAVGDFDSDAIPDIATTTGAVLQDGRRVDALFGRGDGTFPASSTVSAGANPHAITAADLTNSGHDDVVAADGATLNIERGNGNGTFQTGYPFPDGNSNRILVAGDLNGDGLPDIVAVGGSITVLTSVTSPAGSAIIAGTVNAATGVGMPRASIQACPSPSGPCVIASQTTDASGMFRMTVPPGVYAVTAMPDSASGQSSPRTVGPIVAQAGVSVATINFFNPIPPGGSLSGPGGTQSGIVPSVHWHDPLTYTETGCKGGYGTLHVAAVNATTGQPEERLVPLVETPAGSGTYVATIPPVAPLHGNGVVDESIACVGTTTVLPDGGPALGGTPVLLSGSGFSAATGVFFGSVGASAFRVISDRFITAVSPPGTGSSTVTVRLASGTTAAVGTFNRLDVTSVNSMSGPAGGGTVVTITGTGFTSVRGVLFGLLPAAAFSVVSATQIQATSPPGLGAVSIQVVSGYAASESASAAAFTYTGGDPRANAITEGTGPNALVSYASQVNQSGICDNADQTASQNPIPGLVDLCHRARDTAIDAGEHLVYGPLLAGAILVGGGLLIGLGAVALSAVDALATVAFLAFGLVVLGIIVWNIFIDPSGTVIDTYGNPVNGATATLLGPSGNGGPTPIPASGAIISPAVNPETTDSTGEFHWDALAGTYAVQATAPNCHTVGKPSQPQVATSEFDIPPPAVGLLLVLECPASGIATPTVSGLSQAAGPEEGGNQIEISGTGLAMINGVLFGTTPATSVVPLSPFAALATVPRGSGTVDVTVTTPGGSSRVAPGDAFTYVPTVHGSGDPTIGELTPTVGPRSGGTLVAITGTNLSGVTSVTFAGIVATQLVARSATEIDAMAPAALVDGPADVSVRTSGGTSARVPQDVFTYGGVAVAPAFTAASPLPDATVGEPYPAYAFKAAGTPAPAFAVASGALPPGLQLDAITGVLSGRPSTIGTFSFVLRASNGVPPSAVTSVLTITVHAPASPQPGYWLVASDGGIFPFGGAIGYGSTGNIRLNRPVVGMAPAPDSHGYWLVASDGGIFPFGDGGGFGSTGAIRLNRPIVGMAAAPDGQGYWLVAADGGIFPFGDAVGFGSTGAIRLNKPIVGMAATPDGQGYWLVAADGGIFPFGDAVGFGSTGAIRLNKPIVGMAATTTGRGYWLVASDGGIFPFGDAVGYGSTGAVRLVASIVGVAATPTKHGYFLGASDGGVFPFGDGVGAGSLGGIRLNKPVVGIAAPSAAG